MKKFFSTLVVVLIAIISVSTAVIASAQTEVYTLRSRSCLLVDRSGSVKDRDEVEAKLTELDLDDYDFVGYFDDSQISLNPEYKGGGNSSLCERIDEVAQLGYTHVSLLTDGQQWPKDYSCLGVYSDLDLTIYLVGHKEESAEELIDHLEERLINSDLKVVTPEGEEQVVLNDYEPETLSIEIPDPPEDDDNVVVVNPKEDEGKCYWWVALVWAVLLAALFDFIHELITRRRNKKVGQNPAPTPLPATPSSAVAPMPAKATEAIKGGAYVLADFSGSMAAQQAETLSTCKKAGAKTLLCFGDSIKEVSIEEASKIQAGGQTHGWEAVEASARKGWDEIVLVSDLGFNGKAFDQEAFSGKKFRRIVVVCPKNKRHEIEKLELIADEVEVLYL